MGDILRAASRCYGALASLGRGGVQSKGRNGHTDRVTKKHLLLVFSISLVLRLVLYALSDRTPEITYSFKDARGYLQYGRNLAFQGIFSEALEPPYLRSAFRTPAYPLLVAGALRVASDEATALRAILTVQFIFGGLTAVLCTLITYHVMKDTRWAMAAGIVMGFEPQGILYGMYLVTEVPFTFLCLLSVYLLMRHLNSSSPLSSNLLGCAIVMGIASLCRPLSHYVALLVVPMVLLLDSRFPVWPRILRGVLPYILLYGAVIAPWLIRNHLALGVPTLSTLDIPAKVTIAGLLEAKKETPSMVPSIEEVRKGQMRLLKECIADFNRTHETDIRQCANPFLIDQPHLTGKFRSVVDSRTTPIIMEHWGTYAALSARTLVQLLFSFNKNCLARILLITGSEQRLSDLSRDLLQGDFGEVLSQVRRISWIDYIGLLWAAFYSVAVNILAIAGLVWWVWKGKSVLSLPIVGTFTLVAIVTGLGAPFGETLSRYRIPMVPFLVVLSVWGLQFFNQVHRRFKNEQSVPCQPGHSHQA